MDSYILTVTLNPALDKTILIDSLKVGGLNRVISSRLDTGGKGINVAKVLNQFSCGVKAAGLIAGTQGVLLLDKLKACGIDTSFLHISGETRTNLKVVDQSTNTTTEINETGFFVSEQDLSFFIEELTKELGKADLLVLSGSLPPGVDENIYYELIKIAKAKSIRTILDADGKALSAGINALPFAIKPNIHELRDLTGRNIETVKDIVRTAREYIDKGIEIVIVSMGGDGAVVVDKNKAYYAKPFDIVPKSTVGAGDSMVAAFAYSLINGFNLEKTARLITTAGTVTASKPGTEVCSLNEVLINSDKITIMEII